MVIILLVVLLLGVAGHHRVDGLATAFEKPSALIEADWITLQTYYKIEPADVDCRKKPLFDFTSFCTVNFVATFPESIKDDSLVSGVSERGLGMEINSIAIAFMTRGMGRFYLVSDFIGDLSYY